MRHTHVAHLIAAKQQPLKMAKRLGHASAAFIQDRYGHLFEDADSQAAAAVRLRSTKFVIAAALHGISTAGPSL